MWYDVDVRYDADSADALAAELAHTASELEALAARLAGSAATARAGWDGVAAGRFDQADMASRRMAGAIVGDLRRASAAVLDRLDDARADQSRRERLRERDRCLPGGVR